MIDIEPDNFETMNEYYKARSDYIINSLVNNKELDDEDYDYAVNNFYYVSDDVITFTYHDYPYFFKCDDSRCQFKAVMLVPKTVYVWEEV